MSEPNHSATELDDADALFHRALDPYRARNCVYLQSARVSVEEGRVTGTGAFTIPYSCYIDDTGHFNAVEFVICYNQLMYVSLAQSVRAGLIPEMSHWSLEDFWQRQLPNVLIHTLDSRYSRPINPRGFTATFEVQNVSTRSIERGILTLETAVRFSDSAGGRAAGHVGLALTDAPAPHAQ